MRANSCIHIGIVRRDAATTLRGLLLSLTAANALQPPLALITRRRTGRSGARASVRSTDAGVWHPRAAVVKRDQTSRARRRRGPGRRHHSGRRFLGLPAVVKPAGFVPTVVTLTASWLFCPSLKHWSSPSRVAMPRPGLALHRRRDGRREQAPNPSLFRVGDCNASPLSKAGRSSQTSRTARRHSPPPSPRAWPLSAPQQNVRRT